MKAQRAIRSAHYTEGWVGLRTGLDGCGEVKSTEHTGFESPNLWPL